MEMEFGVLGPVRVATPGGAVVEVGGARQRRLLAALVLHAGEVASTDRLLDIVFEGEPPAGASTTIRSYVARLRKALGDAEPGAHELISTARGGYSLHRAKVAIDAARFEASIETARRQLADRDPVGAAETLRHGLTIWRGEAYGEFAFEEWAQSEASRLEELRTVASEELNDALLACGLANDVVSATRGQIGEHPLREKLRRQHMLALYRAGRQVEALRSFDDYQSNLVEVGLEPSDDLVSLARSVASHDPALRLSSPAGQPLRGYRVGSALGEGAHGVVYRAVQPGVGREVAIKMIRAELSDDPEFIRRFDAEAQLVANLQHPHVVPIYDYWREPGGAYIVMRLLGDNLSARLTAGPMDVTMVTATARQLGSALAAAHRSGVVHGDIKPSNVLVDELSAYLADFGVATLVESSAGDGSVSPRSGYESPELLAGEAPSPASDQFALAVLLVQLLTGHLPFGTRAIATRHDRPPSVHVQRPSVPASVDGVLWKATAWDAGDRYSDLETFVDYFEAALAGRTEPEPRDHEVTNPYRGLRAFREVDEGVFFGRDALVAELVEQLARAGLDGRFVVAIGASGSGKSSAARAGLLPRLRAGVVAGSENWLLATMVPGSDPFGNLEAALRAVATADPGPRAAEPDGQEVLRILDRAVSSTQPVLLLVDQLEELFTHVTDESTRRNFVDGLAGAIRRPAANLRVVATLRADYLDRPLRYSDFGQLVKNGAVTIVGMSAAELEAAVTEPAAGVGVEVEPTLATQIIADVLDQPASLPLLQFTLTELFERRTGPVLTLSSYHALGGVAAAVAHRAEAVFGQLTDVNRELARRMFLRLVTVDEARSVSRRRALRSDLVSVANEPDAMDEVIDAFGTSRLLSFDHDPRTREPTVEIAHEALIGQWPRFSHWVDRAGDGLRIQSQIAEATRRWERLDRDGGELYRGLRLESAVELADSQPDALNALESEFVAASENARRSEIEAERLQMEGQRRTNRRLRGLLVGGGVLLVVAVIAGTLAVVQQRQANEQAAEANLATLISRSAAQSAEDSELSLLLALEAHRRSPGPETEQAVLNALGSARIPNRIATGTGLDTGDCITGSAAGAAGLAEYGIIDGRLTSLDLTTGAITDHGPANESCGVWQGDQASGRVVVGAFDTERSWVGTFDDPYAVEVDQPARHFLLPNDLASGVLVLGLIGTGPPAVALHDATTGEARGQPIEGGELRAVAVDPSGSFAAMSFQAFDTADVGRLYVVDAQSGDELYRIDTVAPASSLTFDPATLELVAGTADGHVITVDLVTGEEVASVATTATTGVFEVRVRPDGLVVAVSDGQIELVDRRSGPTGVASEFRDVAATRVRADGTVVTRSADGRFAVIELEGNALVERSWPVDPFARVAFNAGQAGVNNQASQVTEVVDLDSGSRTEYDLLTPDGNRFVAASVYPEPDGVWAIAAEGTMARWEGDTMVERIEFPGRLFTGTRFDDVIGVIVGLDPEPNRDQVAQLVSLEHDAAGVVFSVPATGAVSVHPSLDGGLHVFAHDGTMRTYDRTGELIGEIQTGAVGALINTMNPTTGELAVVSEAQRGGVVVIDPATGDVEHLPEASVANLGFAQGGQLLVITGFDGTVRVWDLDRGEPAGLVWDGTGAGLSSPSWYDESSESIWVFTSGRLLQIPLDPQRWIERACDLVGRNLTPDEWKRHVPGDENPQPTCS